MSSHTTGTIGKELECSICQELLKEPKVAGPCLHTFCKECILNLVECGEGLTESFACPVCRAPCRLPTDGVQGLKTNFTLGNLVEIFRKGSISEWPREEGAEGAQDRPGYVACTMCNAIGRRLQATCVCETCKYITLCDICRKQHGAAAATAEHVLVELCQRHGKPLGMFCKICKCCACAACVSADHTNGAHQVVDLRLVIEDSMKSLDNFMECAEKPMMAALRNSRDTVVMINRQIENRRESLSAAVAARTKVMAAPDQLKREELSKKRAQLLKKLKAIDAEFSELDKNDTERQMKSMDLIGQINSICDAKAKNIQDCVENLNQVEGEMSTAVRMGHTLKSKRIIGAGRHGNITKTAGLLRELMAKVKVDSDVTSFHAEAFRMPAYTCLTGGDLGRLTMSYARKVFDLSFGLRAEFDGDIMAVAATNEGILAALCKTETEQKVYMWTITLSTIKRVIDKSVNPSIDMLVNMAATPDSKLVLLRKKAPQLVIVSPSLGTIKTIKVSKLRDPDSVTVTLDGFYLVMEGAWPANLVVINEKGVIVHSIATECSVQPRLVWGQRAVFTCDWRRIFPYSWLGARFITRQPAFEHAIPDFNMVDLTLGNNTGIFVIGLTGDGRMKLYRLRKEKESEPHGHNEFTFTDERGVGLPGGIRAKCPVSLDVCGSHMIIAYKDLNDQSHAVYCSLLALD